MIISIIEEKAKERLTYLQTQEQTLKSVLIYSIQVIIDRIIFTTATKFLLFFIPYLTDKIIPQFDSFLKKTSKNIFFRYLLYKKRLKLVLISF
jgi:hypothetical protein